MQIDTKDFARQLTPAVLAALKELAPPETEYDQLRDGSLRALVGAIVTGWIVTAGVVLFCDFRNVDQGWEGFALAGAASLSVFGGVVWLYRRLMRYLVRNAKVTAERFTAVTAQLVDLATKMDALAAKVTTAEAAFGYGREYEQAAGAGEVAKVSEITGGRRA